MNLLQNRDTRLRRLEEYYEGRFKGDIDEFAFIWLRIVSKFKKQTIVKVEKECFQSMFNADELLKLLFVYLNILEDNDVPAYEALKDDDGKFDAAVVLEGFVKSLQEYEGAKPGPAQMSIDFYLKETFDKNPVDKILGSKWMSSLAEIYKLKKLDLAFLFTAYIIEKGKDRIEIQEDSDLEAILSAVSGAPVSKCHEFLENHPSYEDIGLWEDKLKNTDFLNEFFKGNESIVISKQDDKDYVDSYKYDRMVEINREQYEIACNFLNQCRGTKNGFFMSVYDQDPYRLQTFIKQMLLENDFNVYTMDSKESLSIDFFKDLTIISSLVAKKKGALILSSEISRFLFNMEESGFDRADGKSTSGYTDMFHFGDEEEKKQPVNTIRLKDDFRTCELLNKIQCPVFLTATPFIENIMGPVMGDGEDDMQYVKSEKPKLNSFFEKFMIYNWALKIPNSNSYKTQLTAFMKKNNIPEEFIETAVNRCYTLKIAPEKWSVIVQKLSAYKGMNETQIKNAIDSFVSKNDRKDNLRKNAHYSLKALNTSIGADELITTIRNAEKWQSENYDQESGLRILLYGISGGGKTAFVEYVSKQLDKDLMFIRTSDFMRSRVGASEYNVRTIFENARENGSIVFIDEAEAILRDRKSLQYNWEITLVNEFIQQMERFPGIMFCSTNLSEFMDSATNRRFHLQVKFNSMTMEGTVDLFEKYFEKYTFTKEQIDKVFNSGEVCPGDFFTVYSRLRFADPDSVSSDYITKLLIEAVENKGKNGKKAMGFML